MAAMISVQCVFVLLSLCLVSCVPLMDPYPEDHGSLKSLTLNCEGSPFEYKETKNDGDSILMKYKCGGVDKSAVLACNKGFKASSKRTEIECDPSNAIFRDTDTDANNSDKATVVWYCMKNNGKPCISRK